MSVIENDNIRQEVRDNYKNIVLNVIGTNGGCCGTDCCTSETTQTTVTVEDISRKLGYTTEELQSIPDGANLGLGCGNPQAIADLKNGETVLDLGSGAGFDCFLASPKVGPSGKVIGVDMTPEMITKARSNATKNQFTNIEFRLGEIENLPVANDIVDCIMSNCVINLSPDKGRVFKEAYRVLKNGGRLAISDIVTTAQLPKEVKENMNLYSGCIAGASSIEELTNMLADAGFQQISIERKDESKEFIKDWAPKYKVEDYIVSATIQAIK